MKPILRLFAFLGSVTLVSAEGGAPRPAEKDPSLEEIQTIRKILELPPERLSRIRIALERLERMPPEARQEYAANLSRFESATPEERRKITKEMRERMGFNGRLLEHHLKALPSGEARAERERILALTPEKRQDFFRQLAEKYGPEISRERGEKARMMEKKDEGKDADRPMTKRRRPEDAPPPPQGRPAVPPGEG